MSVSKQEAPVNSGCMGLIFNLLTGMINRANLGFRVDVMFDSSEPGGKGPSLTDTIRLVFSFDDPSPDKTLPK